MNIYQYFMTKSDEAMNKARYYRFHKEYFLARLWYRLSGYYKEQSLNVTFLECEYEMEV